MPLNRSILSLIFLLVLSVTVAFAVQYVSFENGKQMEIESYSLSDDGWYTFVLKGGGEMSVQKDLIERTGESDDELFFVVKGSMRVRNSSKIIASNGRADDGDSNGNSANSSSSSGADNELKAGSYKGDLSLSENTAVDPYRQKSKEVEYERIEKRKKIGDSMYKEDSLTNFASLGLSVGSGITSGTPFNGSVSLSAMNAGHISFYVSYDPVFLDVLSVNESSVVGGRAGTVTVMKKVRQDLGYIIIGISSNKEAVSGFNSCSLLDIQFLPKIPGDTVIGITNGEVKDLKFGRFNTVCGSKDIKIN